MAACVHIGAVTTVRMPARRECEECVRIGAVRYSHFVMIRTLLTAVVDLGCG